MSKPRPTSFAEVIDRWPEAETPKKTKVTKLYERRYAGSIQTFADDLGITYVRAQMMRYRNSIPPTYFPKVVEAAKRRKIRGITHKLLLEIVPGWQQRRQAS